MKRTNYNKMEEAIESGLHRLKVDSLLKQADKAQGRLSENGGEIQHTPNQMMILINRDLNWMVKQDPGIYKTLQLKRKKIDELFQIVKNSQHLSKEIVDEIIQLKNTIEIYKKEKFSSQSDEELLTAEIEKHVYKRHNVKENWVPLDTHADWNKYKKPRRR